VIHRRVPESHTYFGTCFRVPDFHTFSRNLASDGKSRRNVRWQAAKIERYRGIAAGATLGGKASLDGA
jgi:hypothetical protein